MAHAVLIAARKLRSYFDSQTVQLLTNQPLEKSLHKLDTTGRLLKCAIELSEFDIEYRPRTAIEAQALAGFIVETTYTEPSGSTGVWKIEADGSAAQSGAGAGVFGFKASNNEAEYEAALAGLSLSIAARTKKILMTTDSQLVSSQIEGTQAWEPVMQKYRSKVKSMTAGLQSFEVKLVPRIENMAADALSNLASSTVSDKKRSVMVETLGGTKHRHSSTRRQHHRLEPGMLYKKGFSLPQLRCVTAYEATKIIEEIHEGVCGNHIGGRALALKALRAGFYWPSMLADAQAYVKKCDKCQRFAPVINQPANYLQPILNPIPFAQWGMDIVGPFTPASGGRKFLIVGIDYFTK
ncbi:uncharacterized protein LOC104896920 [Beta vulgaris subsp. vulgaris]|uniref:uncharacterized protein LOC104896920 n=1 Tax=Beta vulgaris subsp. vulgaris TaxID=3555 RepID=UPI002548A9CE|nr:uncharacterized protein LOC104896920 [Beta vulgaris subsp. vulgaris]